MCYQMNTYLQPPKTALLRACFLIDFSRVGAARQPTGHKCAKRLQEDEDEHAGCCSAAVLRAQKTVWGGGMLMGKDGLQSAELAPIEQGGPSRGNKWMQPSSPLVQCRDRGPKARVEPSFSFFFLPRLVEGCGRVRRQNTLPKTLFEIFFKVTAGSCWKLGRTVDCVYNAQTYSMAHSMLLFIATRSTSYPA